MANNSWNALVADVNGKISEMNTAISGANGAASTAKSAAENAKAAAESANAAAETANGQAAQAQKWIGATAEATTVAAGGEASVSISESGGVKKFTFGIPRGADGAKGEKGDTGRSGVTFLLTGTVLSITTE